MTFSHKCSKKLTLALRVTADDNVKSSCSNSASSRYLIKLTGVGTDTLARVLTTENRLMNKFQYKSKERSRITLCECQRVCTIFSTCT